MKRWVIYIVSFLVIAVLNKHLGFIDIPDTKDMQNFQFDLFTICSVLAGFSFTVMGLLTGILSEQVMKKLENTSVVTKKSELILKSVIWFGIPAGLAILFFTKTIDWFCSLIKQPFVRDFLFISQVVCMLVGFFSFFRATKGVYILIQKIYGYNIKSMEEKKKIFSDNLKKAKEKKKSDL